MCPFFPYACPSFLGNVTKYMQICNNIRTPQTWITLIDFCLYHLATFVFWNEIDLEIRTSKLFRSILFRESPGKCHTVSHPQIHAHMPVTISSLLSLLRQQNEHELTCVILLSHRFSLHSCVQKLFVVRMPPTQISRLTWTSASFYNAMNKVKLNVANLMTN